MSSKILNENLVAVHKIKESITLETPAFVEMCILDLSKTSKSKPKTCIETFGMIETNLIIETIQTILYILIKRIIRGLENSATRLLIYQ